MREIFAALAVIPALLMVPAQLTAKGDTVRITIKGGDLAGPIEITDSDVVRRFHVWTGPGTGSSEAPGLIVDWPRGVAEPPKNLPVYEIAFLPTRRNPGTYVVLYLIDPSTNEGFVYLPGKTDAGYADNVWLIAHGVEGNWFHAWSAWEKLAHPLIDKTRTSKERRP
jgi:hypothetical protein